MRKIILSLSLLIGIGLLVYACYRVWNYEFSVITLSDAVYASCIENGHPVEICMNGYTQRFFVTMMHTIMYFFLAFIIPYFTFLISSLIKKDAVPQRPTSIN